MFLYKPQKKIPTPKKKLKKKSQQNLLMLVFTVGIYHIAVAV